jgi:NUMOD3 motif
MKMTQQTKDRISAALRGRKASPKRRAFLRSIGFQAGQRCLHSAERRAKISAALKGRVLTTDHKANIAASLKGIKRSPETLARMAKSQRRRQQRAREQRLNEQL